MDNSAHLVSEDGYLEVRLRAGALVCDNSRAGCCSGCGQKPVECNTTWRYPAQEAEYENTATILLSEDDQLCFFLGGPPNVHSTDRPQALWCVPTGCHRCALFVANDAALMLYNGTHTLPLAGEFSTRHVYTPSASHLS